LTPHDEEEATQPVALDQDDHQAATASRPLPEPDPSERDRVSPDQLPTIGHVGRYALKYCIGEGGLGTVYAAHDPLLSRLIAIKTLQVSLPESDREQFNALFMNEAKAAGSLSHPHIVTLYDAGAGAQGAYIAMELLRGKDLRQLLSVGWRPTPPQAALIVRRVADALSYAHHKGVIHRDIKPANIFMVGRTQPRVLDFGIARLRQAGAEAADDGMSRFGELVGGSPYYMAPEQVRRDPVDRRADVYALGVVLYELLAGRRAFGGNSVDEIHAAVLTKVPKPAHEVNPEVPKALSDIAARAMARDLVQRTRSARTLSQELRDWLDGQADVSAQPLPTRDPASAPDAPALASASSMAPTQPAALMEEVAGSASVRDLTPAWLMAGLASVLIMAAGGWVAWSAMEKRPGATVAVATAANKAPVVLAQPQTVAPDVTQPAVLPPASAPMPAAQGASVPASASAVVTVPSIIAVVPAAVAPSVTQPAEPATAAAPAAVKVVAKGQVKLAISPWGEVLVDRKAMGVAPPLTQLTLPAGRHTVTIRNGEAPPHSQTIEVKPGQAVSITHAF
jgi:eukaryotic-like serine/threonine-protein kinase